MLRGKFRVWNAYITKEETCQIIHLRSHLKRLGKVEQIKPRARRIKDVIKTGVEINEIENRKTVKKINGTKSCFFEKINTIGKLLAISTQIFNMRNGTRDSTIETAKSKIRRKCYKQFYILAFPAKNLLSIGALYYLRIAWIYLLIPV